MIPSVLTFGETMGLAVSADFGSFDHSPSTRIALGGSETNVAIGLRRLGVEATWIGRVGADSIGELIARELRAEQVVATVIVDPTRPTGFMLKERRRPDDTRVTYYRAGSAGSQMGPADLPLDAIGRWSLLHTTGITAALGELPSLAVVEAMRAARLAGVTVSFDLNFRSRLWSESQASTAYRVLLPLCDIVFASEDEARIVVGDGDAEALARRLATFGPRVVVIKRGPEGAVALVDGQIHSRAAVPVNPIDTVGAGDGFVAGFLAEWTTGRTPDESLATAVTVGAFTCLGIGDWESLPHRLELESLGRDPVRR